jgi:FkbM family methyltransferase
MQTAKRAFHGALGLLGIRVIRTGYGAFDWLTRNSPTAARFLGHPYVFVPDEAHRFRWLEALDIRTVLDIGAHEGDYAKRIHGILPKAHIHSFEPIPECYRALTQVSATLPRHSSYNLALGSAPGSATMHKNEFSQASSLLPTSEAMARLMPFAARTEAVTVEVATLDGVVKDLEVEDNLMVKIDVQGFESAVIAGGRDTLRRAKVVVIETSFQPIYETQPMFDVVYRALVNDLGFSYGGSLNRQESPVDGAPLQEDSLFLRS